jgi:hypothetical protein
MPYLYFWEPESQNHGILQAVLPWEDCDRVFDRASAIRLGDEFPKGPINRYGQATVVIFYVLPEEANEKWLAGFYHLDADVTEIREAFVDAPQKARNK